MTNTTDNAAVRLLKEKLLSVERHVKDLLPVVRELKDLESMRDQLRDALARLQPVEPETIFEVIVPTARVCPICDIAECAAHLNSESFKS